MSNNHWWYSNNKVRYFIKCTSRCTCESEIVCMRERVCVCVRERKSESEREWEWVITPTVLSSDNKNQWDPFSPRSKTSEAAAADAKLSLEIGAVVATVVAAAVVVDEADEEVLNYSNSNSSSNFYASSINNSTAASSAAPWPKFWSIEKVYFIGFTPIPK